MQTIKMSGRLIIVGDTKTWKSGFQKREFVLDCTDGKYDNEIQFELLKDRVTLIDKFNIGEVVTVDFVVRGNRWDKDDGTFRHFVSLCAMNITSLAEVSDAPSCVPAPVAVVEDEDLPF